MVGTPNNGCKGQIQRPFKIDTTTLVWRWRIMQVTPGLHGSAQKPGNINRLPLPLQG